MNRRNFLKNAGIAWGILGAAPALASKAMRTNQLTGDTRATNRPYRLMDLHVHTTDEFTIEHIVAVGKKTGIRFGVVDNVAPWKIWDNEALQKHFDTMLPHPVYVGLQPMVLGWSKNLSPELINKTDYVLMDPQVLPNGNRYGDDLKIWEISTYIDDPEFFMQRYFDHTIDVITTPEPLDILGWPLYLPGSIARDYYKLWTKKRLQQIIVAAKEHGVAIEINNTAHSPHEEFIVMAKKAGLKFTFGSDTRNHTMGRLDYCQRVAKTCGLQEKDFFVPERKL